MKLELSQKKYRNLGEALLDFFPKYKDNLFGNNIVLNFTSNIIKIRLEDMSISKHYNCIIVEAENKSTLEKTRQVFYFKDMLKALYPSNDFQNAYIWWYDSISWYGHEITYEMISKIAENIEKYIEIYNY